METKDTPKHPECPPELNVLDDISGKWTILVMYILSDEKKLRFGELQRAVPGISQKVLTQTLRGLERNGLVLRTVYPVVPPQVEYELTSLGRSLVGVLSDMCQWAKKHYPEVKEAYTKYDEAKARA